MVGSKSPQRSLAFEPDDETYARLLANGRNQPHGSRISEAFGGAPQLSSYELKELRSQQDAFRRATQDKSCPVVPRAPVGVSLAENMYWAARSMNPFWFYNQSATTGLGITNNGQRSSRIGGLRADSSEELMT